MSFGGERDTQSKRKRLRAGNLEQPGKRLRKPNKFILLKRRNQVLGLVNEDHGGNFSQIPRKLVQFLPRELCAEPLSRKPEDSPKKSAFLSCAANQLVEIVTNIQSAYATLALDNHSLQRVQGV